MTNIVSGSLQILFFLVKFADPGDVQGQAKKIKAAKIQHSGDRPHKKIHGVKHYDQDYISRWSSTEYQEGITALEIAKSISEGLARKVLAANVNGQVWDATRPVNEDATIKFLTWDDKDGKSTFWHSSAHLMAEAVESMFPTPNSG